MTPLMRVESVVRMLTRVARDVVLARRQLTAHPIFAATFALTMAIGIGANAAVFALVNGVFFKLPPVPEIDKVVHARARSVCKDGVCGPHSDWTSRVRSLRTIAPFAAYTRRQSSVSAAGRAGILSVKGVWGSYFSVLGVNPAVGRLLGPSDDDERSENAAVISDRVWRGWLGGREDVVGQRLTAGDRAFTIVGVVPPKFRGLDRSSVQPTDVWVPLRSEPLVHTPYFIGRLRPESTFEAAASEVRAATIGFDEARPGSYLEPSLLIDALRDFPQTTGRVRPSRLPRPSAVASHRVAGFLNATARQPLTVDSIRVQTRQVPNRGTVRCSSRQPGRPDLVGSAKMVAPTCPP